MLEKDIENLIAQYPEEFFPSAGFKLVGQQAKLGSCFADIVFEDKYNRTVIVEVKRGILSRDASGQIIEYYGLLKQQNPNKTIELILCANIIPSERKVFLENVGIECKELGLTFISNLAHKYNYKFLDDIDQSQAKGSRIEEKPVVLSKGRNVWIFQANPKRYDILNALLDLVPDKQWWMVNQYKKEIKQGDIALIWMSGKEAGIYAIAEIVSDPVFTKDTLESDKYWINEEDKEKPRLRVGIKIIKKLINNPFLREELKDIEGLKNLSILRCPRFTNFPVTNNEWKILKKEIENIAPKKQERQLKLGTHPIYKQ